MISELCGTSVVGVHCANNYSCARTLYGELYVWGQYDPNTEHLTPTLLQAMKSHKVVDVACANTFLVALMETGKGNAHISS